MISEESLYSVEGKCIKYGAGLVTLIFAVYSLFVALFLLKLGSESGSLMNIEATWILVLISYIFGVFSDKFLNFAKDFSESMYVNVTRESSFYMNVVRKVHQNQITGQKLAVICYIALIFIFYTGLDAVISQFSVQEIIIRFNSGNVFDGILDILLVTLAILIIVTILILIIGFLTHVFIMFDKHLTSKH